MLFMLEIRSADEVSNLCVCVVVVCVCCLEIVVCCSFVVREGYGVSLHE